MRRFPAIVLLLVAFSLSLLAPLLLAGAEQSNLPACCRRDGNHHCAKQHSAKPATGVQISALSVCPFFPSGKGSPAPLPLGAIAPAPASLAVAVLALRAPAPRPVATQNDSPRRPWQQRGPPSLVS
ncbi:MAG: hypothetical protein JNM66_04725 [Bryobacterales bacterium]|nr:hypothetical protein [Bryobacterales bacterium]